MQTFSLSFLFKAQMSSLHLVMMSDLLQSAYYNAYFMYLLRIRANYGNTELLKTNFKETLIF